MTDKQKIKKLEKVIIDIKNDANDITKINNKVDDVIEKFKETIYFDGAGLVENKLYEYREKYQNSDVYLNNAQTCVQYEINAIYRDMEREAAKKAREG